MDDADGFLSFRYINNSLSGCLRNEEIMIYNTYFQLDSNQYPYLYTHTIRELQRMIFHQHEYYEFVYIQEGKAVNVIGNQEYALNKGDFSLIVPGESHRLVPEQGCAYRDICISPKLFEECCNLINPEQFLEYITTEKKAKQFSCSAHLTLLLEQKLNYLSIKPNKRDLEAKCIACSVLMELLLELAPKGNDVFDKKIPEWMNTIMIRFQELEFVSRGIPAIIKDINYNEIYINRIFKQYTGMSLRAYLTETKLEFALTYLKFSSHSVNEISDMLGFSSPSFFYKQFKKKYNLTPADYRVTFVSNKQIFISNEHNINGLTARKDRNL